VGVAFLLVVIWILIAVVRMPKGTEGEENFSLLEIGQTLKRLVKRPQYIWGVITQFFYVGAQIGVWSFTIRYVMEELQLNEDDASTYYLIALILFTLSRFVFTALMKFIKPGVLLAIAAIGASISTLIVIFGQGYAGVYALVAISGFMSLMFPTIYGLAVRGLGNDTKIGGSGLIMAILGGAVLTAVQGQVSDITGNIHWAYWVPFICFMVITIYGFIVARQRESA